MQSANQSISVDPEGNCHLSFIDHVNGTIYYAVANNTQFILQKKIGAGLTPPLYSQFRYNIGAGRFTSFETFTTLNNRTAINYYEVNPSEADPGCFGSDTVFLSIEPGNVSNAGFRGNLTTRTSLLLEQNANGLSSAESIGTAVVCTDKNICERIDLTFEQPACATSDTIRIVAHKSEFCKGAVLFLFDSAAVSYHLQPMIQRCY